ncbi:MAG: nucleoside phosphorylase [Bacteroidales bacterium]|nr:nucleoside phosphorylase [Bacteroidales bacterium]MCF8377145.1 nucleoside phosphorylase [Bacteroidales bacterium]MCF8401051.1 nucleoside phosphorylase [Bacteroidales bacterium]
MEKIKESQLIINPDGTIYHLKLKPEDIAETILLVGDPGRVKQISKHFDKIELRATNREIMTHTGRFRGERLTVISTGIGPDNMDIVINELDALANIDFKNRRIREDKKSLNLIRIGTSGTIQPDIPVDTFGIAEYGMGLDNIPSFYKADESVFVREIEKEFVKQSGWPQDLPHPYVIRGDDELFNLLSEGMITGITLTAPGFYGAQGRELRIPPKYPGLNEAIAKFSMNGLRLINYEMETSALYFLGRMLGHKVMTVCAVIANRAREEYTRNPQKTINELIVNVLDRVTG